MRKALSRRKQQMRRTRRRLMRRGDRAAGRFGPLGVEGPEWRSSPPPWPFANIERWRSPPRPAAGGRRIYRPGGEAGRRPSSAASSSAPIAPRRALGSLARPRNIRREECGFGFGFGFDGVSPDPRFPFSGSRLVAVVLRAAPSDEDDGDSVSPLRANNRDDDGPDRRTESRFGVRRRVSSFVRASSEGDDDDGGRGGGESRYGVRSRVRSVLAKARNRTGISNTSEGGGGACGSSSPWKAGAAQSAPAVIAEAAAIGGLGAAFVEEEAGSGVAAVPTDYRSALQKEEEEFEKDSGYGAEVEVSIAAAAAPADLKGRNGASNGVNVSNASSGRNTTSKLTASATAATAPATATTRTSTPSKKKKKSFASTYSPPIKPLPVSNPEDSFLGYGPNGTASSGYSEMDAFRGDVSAAFSMPPEPLPFTLPDLTLQQQRLVSSWERVQYQADMGREGNGFVVWDVRAPSEDVWDILLDFHAYPEMISTVRDMTMYTNTHLKDDYRHEEAVAYEDGSKALLRRGVPSVTRAAFTLSKFRLKIAAIHKYRPHPQGDYMVFTLDPACTNPVLRSAKGVWHTQSNPDGKGGNVTRVWLLCELKVSSLLPQFIVDYTAKKAMPRATAWLKPLVEGRRGNATTTDPLGSGGRTERRRPR